MIVCFCGLDGTGKTTQARRLVRHIIEQHDKCVYHHIIRDSIYYFIVHNIIGRVYPSGKAGLEKELRQKRGALSGALFIIKELFLLLELIFFNLRYAGYRGNMRKHIICDRYFYDEEAQLENLRDKKSFFSRLYEKLIIKPDIVYYIDIPPETAFGRSNDAYGMGFFIRKAGIYRDIMKDKGAVLINDMGEEETAKLVLSHWDSMSLKR